MLKVSLKLLIYIHICVNIERCVLVYLSIDNKLTFSHWLRREVNIFINFYVSVNLKVILCKNQCCFAKRISVVSHTSFYFSYIENFFASDDTCRSDEFTCANKHCIQQMWVCDNDNDCGDNSDEKGCRAVTCHPETDFACSDYYCITSRWRCDGDYDCPDRSDEIGCKVFYRKI